MSIITHLNSRLWFRFYFGFLPPSPLSHISELGLMHALHSLAHRAPPATRTRVRWQPYTSISAASCVVIPSRSPPPYLITPSSSVSSSPPVITPSSNHDRIRQSLQPTNSQVLKDFPFKDSFRNKHAIGLVGQYSAFSIIPHPPDILAPIPRSSRQIIM